MEPLLCSDRLPEVLTTSTSDVDLLVDPAEGASLFDLAQFEIHMEQLIGRPIDVVSRRALDPISDRELLAEAIPL